MATITATIPDFYLRCSWQCENDGTQWVYKHMPNRVIAYKWYRFNNIPNNASIQSVILTLTVSTNTTGIETLELDNVNITAGTTITKDITSAFHGNGEYCLKFNYAAQGETQESTLWISDKIYFTDLFVVVTYSSSQMPADDPVTDNIVLFDRMAEYIYGNGKCVLSPSRCEVSELAGGDYELYLEHPMDELGKWKYIENECIIKSPVPYNQIPSITLPVSKVLNVSADYSYIMSYPNNFVIGNKEMIEDPDSYEYNPEATYHPGDLITDSGFIWRAQPVSEENFPPSYFAIDWEKLYPLTSSDAGTKIRPEGYFPPTYLWDVVEYIEKDSAVDLLDDAIVGECYHVRTMSGNVGYIAVADVEEDSGTADPIVIPSKEIKQQYFRVYKVEAEDETHIVKVHARHISYDYAGDMLLECKFYNATAREVTNFIKGSTAGYDERSLITNITGKTITSDYSYINPVKAILDPDRGMVKKFGAKLIRDNADFYVLSNSSSASKLLIEYGVNLRGVTWSRNTSGVITRVIPVGAKQNDDPLYLDSPVDSQYIGLYPVVKTELLRCDCKIGEERELPDGTTQTLTEARCKAIMENEAQKRFTEDHVDVEDITLDVTFILLGDTEEYSQYKGLQRINLYDTVTVKTGISDINAELQVTEYVWNCLLKRYNSIKLGKINSYRSNVSGFEMRDGTIAYSKLSQELINRIRS